MAANKGAGSKKQTLEEERIGMADSNFDNDTRIGGLWKKETQTGKTYYRGNFSVSDLRDAVKKANGESGLVTLKVWVNDDKNNDRSPDMSVVVAPKFEGGEKVPF